MKLMMSSEEFSTWACEFDIRLEEQEEAEMEDRVNAETHKK